MFHSLTMGIFYYVFLLCVCEYIRQISGEGDRTKCDRFLDPNVRGAQRRVYSYLRFYRIIEISTYIPTFAIEKNLEVLIHQGRCFVDQHDISMHSLP